MRAWRARDRQVSRHSSTVLSTIHPFSLFGPAWVSGALRVRMDAPEKSMIDMRTRDRPGWAAHKNIMVLRYKVRSCGYTHFWPSRSMNDAASMNGHESCS